MTANMTKMTTMKPESNTTMDNLDQSSHYTEVHHIPPSESDVISSYTAIERIEDDATSSNTEIMRLETMSNNALGRRFTEDVKPIPELNSQGTMSSIPSQVSFDNTA
jgi:hypothetical protein